MTNAEYQKRWRDKHRKKHNANRRKRAKRTKNAPKRGTYWMEWEKQAIFGANMTDLELSQELGRSMQAIQSMRNVIRADKKLMDLYNVPFEMPGKKTLSDQPRYKHLRFFKDGNLYEERLGRYEVQDEPDAPSDFGIDEV